MDNKIMKPKITGSLKRFLTGPGHFIYSKLPIGLRKVFFTKMQKYFAMQQFERKSDLDQKCILFLEEEISVFFWGLIGTFFVSAVLFAWAYCGDKSIIVPRNSFGEGQKEQKLILKDTHGEKAVSVTIEEQQITKEEMDVLFQQFFRELEQHMCGKNDTLSGVSQPLCFDDHIDDYPFEISYQPEQLDLIGLDGQLGDAALHLTNDAVRETGIEVKAAYREWEKSRVFHVVLVEPHHPEPISALDKVKENLEHLEKHSRDKQELTFPGQIGDVFIQVPGAFSTVYGLIFLVFMMPVCIVFHRYYVMKERAKKRQTEAAEDFPVIVHLLTLYMKSGLSFSSAIHRISGNYTASADENRRRYAFDEIAWMDRQMQMGVSQKEACASWGKRSQYHMYRKLSATLIQLLSKGSREADRMLEHMEKDAFEQRIDRARKAGKETETRLLFPMMVLLCLVMVIVLFPAVVRFQGF